MMTTLLPLLLLLHVSQSVAQMASTQFETPSPTPTPLPVALKPNALSPPSRASAIPTTYNLTQEISSWSHISLTLALLQLHPGLQTRLSDSRPYLFLAPSNTAWFRLATRLYATAPETTTSPLSISRLLSRLFSRLADPDLLNSLLEFHTISGDWPETLLTSRTTMTLSGSQLDMSLYPKISHIDTPISRRLYRQILATNGRLAIISNVLLPFKLSFLHTSPQLRFDFQSFITNIPTMASSTFTFDVSEDVTFESTRNLISKRSDLLIFNAVLTLLPDLSAKLSTQRSFAHVFAPNDDAFVAFLTDIAPWDGAIDLRHIGNMTRIISALSKVSSLWNAVDSLPSFEQLISYHILGTARSYTSLPKDRRLGTLFPNASVSLSDKGVTDSDESRGISQHIATFATQNGHVSVLRGVLSPFNTAVARAMLINSMQQEQTKPTSTPVETIIGDEPACFPGDSVARTQGGEVKMRHLEAGMALYTGDKQQKTSPIYLFTHRLQDETLREFVRVTTRNRNVTLTAGHYLYVNGRLTAAGATKRGDWIRTDVGRRRVIKVQRVWRRGLYAPHTMQGDLIVDGVVVSCYSTAVAPWFAHAVLAPVRMAARCGWKEPLGGLLYVGAEVWRTVLPRGRL